MDRSGSSRDAAGQASSLRSAPRGKSTSLLVIDEFISDLISFQFHYSVLQNLHVEQLKKEKKRDVGSVYGGLLEQPAKMPYVTSKRREEEEAEERQSPSTVN